MKIHRILKFNTKTSAMKITSLYWLRIDWHRLTMSPSTKLWTIHSTIFDTSFYSLNLTMKRYFATHHIPPGLSHKVVTVVNGEFVHRLLHYIDQLKGRNNGNLLNYSAPNLLDSFNMKYTIVQFTETQCYVHYVWMFLKRLSGFIVSSCWSIDCKLLHISSIHRA